MKWPLAINVIAELETSSASTRQVFTGERSELQSANILAYHLFIDRIRAPLISKRLNLNVVRKGSGGEEKRKEKKRKEEKRKDVGLNEAEWRRPERGDRISVGINFKLHSKEAESEGEEESEWNWGKQRRRGRRRRGSGKGFYKSAMNSSDQQHLSNSIRRHRHLN